NTLVPKDGHLLVLVNGAYGKRMQKLAQMMGRRTSVFETAEDVPTTAADVDRHRESARGDRRYGGEASARADRRRDELVRRAADRRTGDAVRRADRGL